MHIYTYVIYTYVLFIWKDSNFYQASLSTYTFCWGLAKYQNQFHPHVQAISARSWKHFWKVLTKSLSSLRARDPLAPLMLGHLLKGHLLPKRCWVEICWVVDRRVLSYEIISWVVPLSSDSHHQDSNIFFKGIPLNLWFATVIRVWGQPE